VQYNFTAELRREAMFRVDEIQARLRERPFVPLRIVTSSGESYDVIHPDLVLVGERSLIVGIASNSNPTIFAATSHVALMHITELQDLPITPPKETPGKNGPTA
jgi:hypothetical protein